YLQSIDNDSLLPLLYIEPEDRHDRHSTLLLEVLGEVNGRVAVPTRRYVAISRRHITAGNAEGDWLYGGVECSILPHFILSASDLWNVGTSRTHYYMLAASGSWTRHSVRLSYGRTRAGINCSGGICRFMPETHGLYLSYQFAL
ncbi:MAG: DUF6029 family protein, partial [Porphyromonas sp.]